MNAQTESTYTERQAILDALSTWIRQRPGLDYRNYSSGWNDVEGRRAYFRELRSITRDLHDARALLAAIGWRDSITADALKEAFRAYSGRLTWTPNANGTTGGTLDYCTGQYWPTEYRRAVCAVLSSALWAYFRANAEEAQKQGPKCDAFPDLPEHPYNCGHCNGSGHEGPSLGDRIRKMARVELGNAIARRWFN